jgi:hypothetical protein
MKLANMKIDHKLSEEGEWVKNIPNADDLELRVRGLTCAPARILRNKLIRALPAAVRNNPDGLPPDVLDRIEATIVAEVILLDWRNLDEGAYSKEMAAQYLSDPDYIEFRDAVVWASGRVGRQKAAATETDLGNFATISAGS